MHDLMTTKRQREIVIEFERIQMIRKRAKTILKYCEGCRAESDLVSHVEAAELFEITPGELIRFIEQNKCHYQVSYNGKTYLCVISLLEHLHRQNNFRQLGERSVNL